MLRVGTLFIPSLKRREIPNILESGLSDVHESNKREANIRQYFTTSRRKDWLLCNNLSRIGVAH